MQFSQGWYTQNNIDIIDLREVQTRKSDLSSDTKRILPNFMNIRNRHLLIVVKSLKYSHYINPLGVFVDKKSVGYV